jgi:hypothetical protein
LNSRPRSLFFCGSGGGSPRCRQITASSLSSGMSLPSTTISSATITAGATGRSSSKYSSVEYSALGLDMVSISNSYFWPSLGIISWKCFHGLPLGSFMKNLTFSIFFSFLARMFHNCHMFYKLRRRQKIYHPQITPLSAIFV